MGRAGKERGWAAGRCPSGQEGLGKGVFPAGGWAEKHLLRGVENEELNSNVGLAE